MEIFPSLLKFQQVFVILYLLKFQQVFLWEVNQMEERFETFTVLLNRINRNIRKIKNKEMSNYEIRSPHISCLYYLYISKELTSKDLCERCEEDKATISRSLDYLEKNNYIICKSQSKKRYNAPFELTERGARAGKRIADKISAVLEEISTGISDEDRAIFYRSLNVISENIEKIAKSYE
jgi:DNA-binding MarR family transcriptional regulator